MSNITSEDLYCKLREFINIPKEVISLELKIINDNYPIIDLTVYAQLNDNKDLINNYNGFKTIDKKFAVIDFDDLELFKKFKKKDFNDTKYFRHIVKKEKLENITKKGKLENIISSQSFLDIYFVYVEEEKDLQNQIRNYGWYIFDKRNTVVCGVNFNWRDSTSGIKHLGALFKTEQQAQNALEDYLTKGVTKC